MRSNMDPEACAWLRLVGEVDQMLAEVASMREHARAIITEAESLRHELEALEASEASDLSAPRNTGAADNGPNEPPETP